ncbi:Forkhead box protein J3 [Linnemannia zychae]|nr:Forkhead box protein J3 [Linnemannia zychae]
MPALIDVNESSQLPSQPHHSQQEQQERQQQQSQHTLCAGAATATPRQLLANINHNIELAFTRKDETLSVVPTIDPDNKENCSPSLLPKNLRKRSQSVVTPKRVIESMPVLTRSLSFSSKSDTLIKCGSFSEASDEDVITKVKGEDRDNSKETNLIDVESTSGDGVITEVLIPALSDKCHQVGKLQQCEKGQASTDMHRKPDISYSHLILHAISQSANERLTLREIYAWIETRYPFYRDSPSGWQNSIRHNLSSSKAFIKLEKTKSDTGKGCFWALHENAQEILAASSSKKGRKSLADQDDSTPAGSILSPAMTVRLRNVSTSLPKLDCKADGSPRIDLPSPAFSEPRDGPTSPRPVRTKTKEVFAPSTPPSSPDYDAELDDKGVHGNRSEGISIDKQLLETKTPQLHSTESPPLTISRRIRRPPQNLSEFVSSEDFKASFGHESVPNTPLSPKSVEKKRSKTHSVAASRERSSSSEHVLSKESSLSPTSTNSPTPILSIEEFSALALTPSQELSEVPLHQLVSVPLSSLSHMTHSKRSRDDLVPGTTSKRWRREDQHHRRRCERSNLLHETVYERRIREGKREIVVASENDWSDSDSDPLCDADLDGYLGSSRSQDASFSSNRASQLLLDSSAISYGFEMTDSEYILDFNQGPMFNSVVWPEYSNFSGLPNHTDD